MIGRDGHSERKNTIKTEPSEEPPPKKGGDILVRGGGVLQSKL